LRVGQRLQERPRHGIEDMDPCLPLADGDQLVVGRECRRMKGGDFGIDPLGADQPADPVHELLRRTRKAQVPLAVPYEIVNRVGVVVDLRILHELSLKEECLAVRGPHRVGDVAEPLFGASCELVGVVLSDEVLRVLVVALVEGGKRLPRTGERRVEQRRIIQGPDGPLLDIEVFAVSDQEVAIR
jgi:hypothetical protein